MTLKPDTSPVGYGGLRDLPLRKLIVELDQIEDLLAHRSDSAHHGAPGRDPTIEALRARERAVVAEIRRRPGGVRPWHVQRRRRHAAPPP